MTGRIHDFVDHRCADVGTVVNFFDTDPPAGVMEQQP